MLWLATLPVLNIYLALPGFTWASLLFIFIAIIALYYKKNFDSIFKLPKSYIIFWVFAAISFTIASIKFGYIYRAFFPGGLALFLFSIQLGFGSKLFNINYFYRFSRITSIITIVILVLQELCYFSTGHRFSALFPYGKLTDGIPISSLIQFQLIIDRSSSIFREPAHAAQFLLVVLALELFWKGLDKLYTNFAIFLGIGLIMLRSGNGLLGMLLLVVIKTYYYLNQNKSRYKYLVLTIGSALCITILGYYESTESGSKTLGRVSEFENNESSKSYVRIYRGFALLSDSPTEVKLIGTSNDGILRIIHSSPVGYLFEGDRDESDLYFNGVSTIILHTGYLGLLLFSIYIIKCLKGAKELPRALIILLIIISFIESTYLSSLMLTICIVLNAYYYKNKKQINNHHYYNPIAKSS